MESHVVPHSPSRYFGADVSAEKLKMYHPDFARYLRNRWASRRERAARVSNDDRRRFPQWNSSPCVKVCHRPPSATLHSRRILFPFRFLRSGILHTSYKSIYRVTTGAMMLLAALHTCDQVHVVHQLCSSARQSSCYKIGLCRYFFFTSDTILLFQPSSSANI